VSVSTFSGKELKNYLLKYKIGEGGMAQVYLATKKTPSITDRRRLIETTYAIKILTNPKPGYKERLDSEIITLTHLKHHHITRIVDWGQDEDEDVYYIVMDYYSNGTLAKKIEDGSLTIEEVIEILKPLASALDYAHRKGVIHRDVKPSNVLFDENNTPCLSDFGIAHYPYLNEISDDKIASGLTPSGILLGTFKYMAPEVFDGARKASPRSDFYAFGLMAYEMIKGELAFDETSLRSLMESHFKRMPEPLYVINPDISRAINDVINKMIAKEPQNRYGSAVEFVNELEKASKPVAQEYILNDDTVIIEKPSYLRRVSPNYVFGAVVGVLTLIVALLLTNQFLNGGQNVAQSNITPSSSDILVAMITQPSVSPPTVTPTSSVTGTSVEMRSILTEDPVSATPTPTSTSTPIYTFTPSWTPTPTATDTPIYTPSLAPWTGQSVRSSVLNGTINLIFMPNQCLLEWQNETDCVNQEAWIGAQAVSNTHYRICVNAGKCSRPTDTSFYDQAALSFEPVVFVNWAMAQQFCTWFGGRLPTQAEWEYAMNSSSQTLVAQPNLREWTSITKDGQKIITVLKTNTGLIEIVNLEASTAIDRVGFRCVMDYRAMSS
jgi:serine/threonine protein kinase